jgi:hypothetical protein
MRVNNIYIVKDNSDRDLYMGILSSGDVIFTELEVTSGLHKGYDTDRCIVFNGAVSIEDVIEGGINFNELTMIKGEEWSSK